jgi:hypothetical protein
MMLAVVSVSRPRRIAVVLLAATVLLAGCAGGGRRPTVQAGYTCAQLTTDFRKPGDAPADRGQAVVDSIVAKIGRGDDATTNVRDATVYALAAECSRHPSSWHPLRGALRAVEHIYHAP